MKINFEIETEEFTSMFSSITEMFKAYADYMTKSESNKTKEEEIQKKAEIQRRFTDVIFSVDQMKK